MDTFNKKLKSIVNYEKARRKIEVPVVEKYRLSDFVNIG